MTTRSEARADLASGQDDDFRAVAPWLAAAGAGLVLVVISALLLLIKVWLHTSDATSLVLPLVIACAAAAFARPQVYFALALPLLALSIVLQNALACALLPDPRLPDSAHGRLQRKAAMARARRRARRIGLGAGWIGSGAALLDRRGRVRLMRRP